MECGRGAGEIWARYGRDAGEARLRASLQTRSKRDPGEIHRPRCPCGAAREGRAQGQPTQTARAARVRVAGPARPLAHGKDLRAKRKGAGSASHQASPTLPATEATALLLLWTTFATTGRRTSIQTLRLGSAPSASAATSSPHSAPQQCDPNDCGGEGGIGDERCTVVGAVEARGRRRACAAPTMSRNSGSSAKRQRVIAVMGLMMSRTTRQVGQCQQLCLMVNSTSHQIGKERACLVVERKEESRALGRPEASY